MTGKVKAFKNCWGINLVFDDKNGQISFDFAGFFLRMIFLPKFQLEGLCAISVYLCGSLHISSVRLFFRITVRKKSEHFWGAFSVLLTAWFLGPMVDFETFIDSSLLYTLNERHVVIELISIIPSEVATSQFSHS